MYYSYHNIIKRKLNEGKLIDYEYVDSYHNISPALLLFFDDESVYPIREYSWFKYELYLNEFDKRKNKKL